MEKSRLTVIIAVFAVMIALGVGFLAGRISKKDGTGRDDTAVEISDSSDSSVSPQPGKATGSHDPAQNAGATDIPEATQAVELTSTPGPTQSTEGAESPGQTQAVEITAAPVPTEAAGSTDMSTVTQDTELTGTPGPTQSTEGAESTGPTQVAEITAAPVPTEVAGTTDSPVPTQTAEQTGTPEPTQSVRVTDSPAPTQKPAPTAVPTPTPAVTRTEKGTPYESHGRLAVNGTKLVDKNGDEYRLRGVSTHGIAWFPDYVNKQAFQTLRDDWGVNCIRLAMYTAEYNGYCSGGNKSELKRLVDNGVKYATELGLYVIIDWHILSDSNPLTNKDEAIAFFTEMSRKYAENGNIIYEICNEPNGGTNWSQIKTYAGEVIPVIRKNAPKAIIVVGTPTWSQEVDKAAADPIKDYDNIMYTIHFYAATHKDDLRKRMQAAVRSGIALFCTEFGTCDASGNGGNDFTEAEKWIDAMEASGVSYCIWNLSNKAETSALISSGSSKTSGWKESDLSASGKWYASLLRSKAGAGSVSPGIGEGIAEDRTGGSGIGKDGKGKDSSESDAVKDDTEKDSSGSDAVKDGTGKDSSGSDTVKDDTGKNSTGNNTDKEDTGNENTGDDHQKDNSDNDNGNSLLQPVTVSKGETRIVLSNTGGWNDGKNSYLQFTLSIRNDGNSAVENWKITLEFSGKYALSQTWNGTFEEKGKELIIKPVDYNSVIEKGGSAEVGFIISTEEPGEMPEIKTVSGF